MSVDPDQDNRAKQEDDIPRLGILAAMPKRSLSRIVLLLAALAGIIYLRQRNRFDRGLHVERVSRSLFGGAEAKVAHDQGTRRPTGRHFALALAGGKNQLMSSVGTPVVWGVFALVVVIALAIDLGLFHRQARELRMREAAVWVGVWVLLAGAFNAYVLQRFGVAKGLEFSQGYLLELALSTDNLFVFLVIFSYFRVPRAYQHRVLFWGIVGAVLTRGLFIAVGAAAIHRFRWILYLLGAFLLYAAFKLIVHKEAEIDPSRNPVLRLFRRLVPVAEDDTSPSFTVRRQGKILATPLLAVLIVVEAVDVTFAVDSIPAIFGVTTDVFIVLTSNVFAILGLRSLYFLVSGLAKKLAYLNYGIASVLAFIGAKIVLGPFVSIPVLLSLAIVVSALTIATVASLVAGQRLSK